MRGPTTSKAAILAADFSLVPAGGCPAPGGCSAVGCPAVGSGSPSSLTASGYVRENRYLGSRE